jgi:hypothetical protein
MCRMGICVSQAVRHIQDENLQAWVLVSELQCFCRRIHKWFIFHPLNCEPQHPIMSRGKRAETLRRQLRCIDHAMGRSPKDSEQPPRGRARDRKPKRTSLQPQAKPQRPNGNPKPPTNKFYYLWMIADNLPNGLLVTRYLRSTSWGESNCCKGRLQLFLNAWRARSDAPRSS